jgi:hypothetical protein
MLKGTTVINLKMNLAYEGCLEIPHIPIGINFQF